VLATNHTQLLIPKGLIVHMANKWNIGSVTCSQFLFRFIETICEHAPWNKLCGSTNFIIFRPTDQKLWVFENFRRSLGKAGMCLSQPARVDHINPKRWEQE
jgi:hypothetical protein